MSAVLSQPYVCGLLPVTGPDPRVLILGSYPSVLSLAHREYYGNSKNRFWAVMEKILGVPAGLPYAERTLRLTKNNIALWDVVRTCERPCSENSRIKDPVPNDLAEFFREHPTLRLVALNGGTAGSTTNSLRYRASLLFRCRQRARLMQRWGLRRRCGCGWRGFCDPAPFPSSDQ